MKLKRKVFVFMLALTIAVSGVGTSMMAEAKCTGWTEYKAGKSYCDDSDGCGAFWLQDTKKYKSYQERYCDKNNKQKREKRTTYIRLGCCNK